jgi:hypothetical protein
MIFAKKNRTKKRGHDQGHWYGHSHAIHNVSRYGRKIHVHAPRTKLSL